MLIRKSLLVIAIPIAIYVAAGNAYGASEFLLKNTADKKYGDFSSCLKSNKNLFTKCIAELKHYISAENKYIRVKKIDDSKNRLRKVVKYIKQSTDLYIQKAEQTNDVVDYNQAAVAASLLTKLSPVYETEYASFLKKATARERGGSVSLALSTYFDTVKQREPEFKVIRKLIDNALPVYDFLDANLRSSLDKYFDAFIDRYYDYLVQINRSIESKTFPEVSKLEYRYQAYIQVIEIHQIDSRSEDIAQITQQIADTLNQHFENLVAQAEDLNVRFVSGAELDGEEVQMQVRYITYFFDMAPIISQNRDFGFSKVREFPQNVIDDLANHRSFYPQSLVVPQSVRSHLYSDALNQSDASMADAYQKRLVNEVVQRVNRDANSAINYYQQVFKENKLKGLSLLLALPTKYFNDESNDKRFSELDQFVTLVFREIDSHVDNGNHRTAFEVLQKLKNVPGYIDRYQKPHQDKHLAVLDNYADTLFREIDSHVDNGNHRTAFEVLQKLKNFPGYIDRYEKPHQDKHLAVLDNYADTLFYKVAALIEDDDYDAVFDHLKFAESVSGYLKRYEEKHEELVGNARRSADVYWLNGIVEVAEDESFSAAIDVISTKIYASDKRQSAAEKLVDFAGNKFSELSQKLGFQELLSTLKSLRAIDNVSDIKAGTLDKLISKTYESWVISKIKGGNFVSAARHIFESGNSLSVDLQSELSRDLINTVNAGSKKDPQAMITVLVEMSKITTIPTEIKTSIDNLVQEIVHRWAMKIAKNGIVSCNDWKILTIGFDANMGWEYMVAPPIGGPKEKGQYYVWPCTISNVYSKKKLACKAPNETYFLVDGIKQSFPEEIRQSGTYLVMGEYNRNEKTSLDQLVPVLEDTYISACY